MGFGEIMKEKADSQLFQFIFKNFLWASFAFLLFGVITIPVSYFIGIWLLQIAQTVDSGRILLFFIAPFALMFLLMFLNFKWMRNIEGASTSLIAANYIVLVSFLILIIAPGLAILAFYGLNNIETATAESFLYQIGINGAIIFGGSWLIYLIPALVGYFLKNAKIAQTIGRVILFSIFIMFILLLIAWIVFIATRSAATYNTISLVVVGFWGVIVLLSPILTIYSMKRVARHIDYSNRHAINRWSAFFIYEIFRGMLQIVLWLLQILLRRQ